MKRLQLPYFLITNNRRIFQRYNPELSDQLFITRSTKSSSFLRLFVTLFSCLLLYHNCPQKAATRNFTLLMFDLTVYQQNRLVCLSTQIPKHNQSNGMFTVSNQQFTDFQIESSLPDRSRNMYSTASHDSALLY